MGRCEIAFRGVRVLVYAMGVIIEAFRMIIEAVRLFVESVGVLVKTERGLLGGRKCDFETLKMLLEAAECLSRP